MKLSKERLQAFNNLVISVRSIKLFNPSEFRPNLSNPLTIEVNYFIRGNPLIDGERGRAITVQECTDIVNMSLLDEHEELKDKVYDAMYAIKRLIASNIEMGMGLKDAKLDMGEPSGNNQEVQSMPAGEQSS